MKDGHHFEDTQKHVTKNEIVEMFRVFCVHMKFLLFLRVGGLKSHVMSQFEMDGGHIVAH